MSFLTDGPGLGQKTRPDGWPMPRFSALGFVRPDPARVMPRNAEGEQGGERMGEIG